MYPMMQWDWLEGCGQERYRGRDCSHLMESFQRSGFVAARLEGIPVILGCVSYERVGLLLLAVRPPHRPFRRHTLRERSSRFCQ